ncbi:MAG: hypothetical protein IIA87_01200 [Nanoarchaeota archaeon]|nr:hypothetical protein [Nanoarchaeota archaeon]
MTDGPTIARNIVYGAFTGLVYGFCYIILYMITTSLVPGSYNPLNTVPDSLLLSFVFQIVGSIPIGIIFSLIVFFLVTRAKMNQNLRNYIIVALALQGAFFILDFTSAMGNVEFDLFVDGPIMFINELVLANVLALVFFHTEKHFYKKNIITNEGKKHE